MTDDATQGAVVLLPGSGSTPEFVRRAFSDVARPATSGDLPARTVVVDSRSGDPFLMADRLATTAAELTANGTSITTVCGVSIGAHAIAIWAAESGVRDCPLLLVMPAWTEDPGPVGAATLHAAHRIQAHGIAEDLRQLRLAYPQDWVVDELERAWPLFTEAELAAAFTRTAAAPGPGHARLASIRCPTAVVGLRDDPMHPAEVAATWAATIPCATLVELDRQSPTGDAAVLGRAGLTALSGSR